MKTVLGPIPRDRIILCSADAGPNSQRTVPERAGHFFSGAVWVGTIRNTADRLGHRFVVLTTGHGLVDSNEVIAPYDVHINDYPQRVAETWRRTVPRILGNSQNSLMIFYAGGCPRDQYIDILKPNLQPLGISLLTFGRPNMFDIDKMERVIEMLLQGAPLNKFTSALDHPERFEFYFHIAQFQGGGQQRRAADWPSACGLGQPLTPGAFLFFGRLRLHSGAIPLPGGADVRPKC